MHRLVEGVDEGKKIPLFLPIGEDALERLQVRLSKVGKLLKEVAPWSVDLGKDNGKAKAKL